MSDIINTQFRIEYFQEGLQKMNNILNEPIKIILDVLFKAKISENSDYFINIKNYDNNLTFIAKFYASIANLSKANIQLKISKSSNLNIFE